MNSDSAETLPCPTCNHQTNSLKQMRVIQSIVGFPLAVVFSSVIVRRCPRCMRAFLWDRCLVNGLTTRIVGYVVLVPYTLALTLGTISKGHSWQVRRGVTPEMELSRKWSYETSLFDKVLAVISLPLSLLPGIGFLVCCTILWKVRLSTDWVHKMAEIASFIAVFSTIIAIGLYIDPSWLNRRNQWR
jgi:hypothetical protein